MRWGSLLAMDDGAKPSSAQRVKVRVPLLPAGPVRVTVQDWVLPLHERVREAEAP